MDVEIQFEATLLDAQGSIKGDIKAALQRVGGMKIDPDSLQINLFDLSGPVPIGTEPRRVVTPGQPATFGAVSSHKVKP